MILPAGTRNCLEKKGMIPFNRTRVLDILHESESRLTARAYIREIARELSLTQANAKKILKVLVDTQDVAYQDLYGATYVMEGFSKPVRITDRFFVLPPGIKSIAKANEIDLRILQGISFGSGHHPTTKLCLKALDRLFFSKTHVHQFPGDSAGDVGTGSGVLAIAACLAGMSHCSAWEIDANAVSEARQNVIANKLEQKITVIDGFMDVKHTKLALITANLRFPTLKQLAPLIRDALIPGAALVLSGIRSWEKVELIDHYSALGFTHDWDRDEKNWSAVTLLLPG